MACRRSIAFLRNARRERPSPLRGRAAAPFDAASLPLLNALPGAAGADPSNADGIGCGAVGGTLAMTGPGFLNALGSPEDCRYLLYELTKLPAVKLE